jgi:hypothetical protein
MEIIMQTSNFGFCQYFRLTVAGLLTALCLNAAHGQAQPDGAPGGGKPAPSPLPATTPAEIIKPVPLSELKSPDAVFDKLDRGQRGYVTRQETNDLIGFGDAFQAVDSTGSGKLTRAQFRKAWALYQQAAKK